MRTYVESKLAAEEIQLFRMIEQCVQSLPDNLDLGKDERGDELELSCHILARAVGRVFNLKVEDGFYIVGFEHSWIRTPEGHVIDPLPVGVLGGPILMDGTFFGLSHHLYRQAGSDPRRPKGHYKKRFDNPNFKRAITLVAHLLRKTKKSLTATA